MLEHTELQVSMRHLVPKAGRTVGSGGEISEMERHEAWFVAITTAVIGFIAGMAWSDFDHQARWLYDYQTLVTGTLAVAAAFITVNAMNKTEDRQQKRHDQLIEMTADSSRLKFQRAAFFAPLFLEEAKDLDMAFARMMDAEATTQEAGVKMFIYSWTNINRHMKTRQIQDARELFNVRMTGSCEVIERACLAVDETRKKIYRSGNEQLDEDTLSRTIQIFAKISPSTLILKDFANKLGMLKSRPS
ncbi:hypothetical protein [Mesorhizobium sp. M0578]|uniref:hypothetical protein n=1 Tax=unclassified Mesorhizobium TaxID=325217 RepID=UPI00333A6D1D